MVWLLGVKLLNPIEQKSTLWNSICDELRQISKRAFKKHINDMLLWLLEVEDDYDEVPILLYKIANYTVWFIQYK